MLAVLPICVEQTVVAACRLILQEPDVYAVAAGACMPSKLYRKRCFPVESARPLTLVTALAGRCHAVQDATFTGCMLAVSTALLLHRSAISVQGPYERSASILVR